MNNTVQTMDYTNKKYLSIEDAKNYYNLCRASIMKISTESNAIRRIGRRVLIDKVILDKYIENQNTANA